MKINNRRYIGCKYKLLDFIYDEVEKYNFDKGSVFLDLFSGTGVVANKFAEEGYKVIVNDTLYSNVVVYKALLGEGKIDRDKLEQVINYLNNVNSADLEDNYFSNVYGGKYYSFNDAKKIGFIRDWIEDNKDKFTEREYFYLISCLLYACDKIANTVGHFESFLKNTELVDKDIVLSMFDVNDDIIPADIYNEDANELVRKVSATVAYLDPPYNARQYVNFYHLLENLARWNKPTEFEGNSMKFKRNELKSDYCRKKAPDLMKDLVLSLKCDLIVVSYNNTYTAKSTSSNNMITSEQLEEILSLRGKVKIVEKDYRAFNSGKTDLKGHKELLYICEVNK